MRKRITLLAVIGAALIAACAGDGGGVEVSDIRVGQPTGPNAALYFTATNGGDADRLIGASTDAASAVELHETVMDDHGMMGMAPVDELELPAGGTLVLEPGGYHLMLVDAERMEVGATVEVTLTWENAGEMALEAEVVEPPEAMGDMDHGDMEMDDGASDG